MLTMSKEDFAQLVVTIKRDKPMENAFDNLLRTLHPSGNYNIITIINPLTCFFEKTLDDRLDELGVDWVHAFSDELHSRTYICRTVQDAVLLRLSFDAPAP